MKITQELMDDLSVNLEQRFTDIEDRLEELEGGDVDEVKIKINIAPPKIEPLKERAQWHDVVILWNGEYYANATQGPYRWSDDREIVVASFPSRENAERYARYKNQFRKFA